MTSDAEAAIAAAVSALLGDGSDEDDGPLPLVELEELVVREQPQRALARRGERRVLRSIRLAAMLRGITFIGDVGGVLLRSSSHRRRYRSNKDDNQGAMVALGLGLYLIGLLGGLMAGLIKSAISKQKEYLADASAVQFTRNPEGIGNALKVIGGLDSGTMVEATASRWW